MMILDQLLFVRGAPSEDLRSRMERLMAKTLPDIVPAWMWERAKVLILLRSGAYTQALKELDAIDTNEAPIQWRAFYTAMRTILLSRLGRIEDARAIMPRLRSETAELDRAPAETGTGYDLVRIHAIVAEAMAEPGLVQTQARVAPSVALGSLVPSFGLAFSLRRRPFL
ncbi:hypothetical protein EON77_00220 [bacterium]|nr:MAG: hypothetical protein EON77_00220 [bacterium]